MSRKASPTLIGSFVLGGVILSVLAVVVLGSERMFRDTESFVSFFEGSVAGLDAGAPVRFRGIEVGEVREVLLDLPGVDRLSADVRIAVIYDIDRQLLESRGATARLSDPLDPDLLLAMGIRAELATESLVTGRKYIALDLQPTIPLESDPVAGVPYPEIPTLDTGLDRIEEELYGIIAELGAVKLDSLVSVATSTLTDIGTLASKPELRAALDELPGTISGLNASLAEVRTLVADVDASLEPVRDELLGTSVRAAATMQRFESTLDAMDGVLGPRSPVLVRFEQAMLDLSAASSALRNLADYLERNPSALIRGRPGGDG